MNPKKELLWPMGQPTTEQTSVEDSGAAELGTAIQESFRGAPSWLILAP